MAPPLPDALREPAAGLVYLRPVPTTVYLVRHGVTDWHREHRVLGHRDLGLSEAGRAQADAAALALADQPISEVLASPLLRALETAERLAAPRKIQVARDKRLIEMTAGKWEGLTTSEIAATPEYQRFLADPDADAVPGGERLSQVRDRAMRALEQALTDTPAGEAIAIVSHASILRLLVATALGAPPTAYHRLHLAPGSVSVLQVDGVGALPRLLVMNWLPSVGVRDAM